MFKYEVTYDILIEERTDSYLGSTRSDMQNLKIVVQANGPSQAQQIVEQMFGGSSRCRVYSAIRIE